MNIVIIAIVSFELEILPIVGRQYGEPPNDETKHLHIELTFHPIFRVEKRLFEQIFYSNEQLVGPDYIYSF